jgi:predicted MFS family arabinose efflux permease
MPAARYINAQLLRAAVGFIPIRCDASLTVIDPPGTETFSAAVRRWYVLIILTLVYALSIADRYVMSTLIEPIKAALHLSDSAIGFLTGVALAIFYVTAGLPLATLADRANRRTMIALALAAWSAMTAFCGIAQNFWQLLLARIGVGVGEAGGTPPSTSLVSDYFPWRRRALALSVYSIGASIGSMLGSSAGYASDAWGWRVAFLLLGIPGIALAILIRVTVREPQRGRLDEGPAPPKAGLLATVKFAIKQPALLHTLLGASVYTLWAWGLMWWTPSYLVRSHHMSLGEAGGALSLMHGIGGTSVLILTMLLMGRLANRDARLVPWFVAAVILIATIPSIMVYTSASRALAIAMLWIFIPLSYAPFGPTFALLQNLVPSCMRAQTVALMLFFSNVANLVIAPQAIGFASDDLAPAYGTESLRHALVPLAFVGFWAAWHYWMSAKYLTSGLQRAGNTSLAVAAS